MTVVCEEFEDWAEIDKIFPMRVMYGGMFFGKCSEPTEEYYFCCCGDKTYFAEGRVSRPENLCRKFEVENLSPVVVVYEEMKTGKQRFFKFYDKDNPVPTKSRIKRWQDRKRNPKKRTFGKV